MKPENGMDFLIGVAMFNVTSINLELKNPHPIEEVKKMKQLRNKIQESVTAVSKYRTITFGKGEVNDINHKV